MSDAARDGEQISGGGGVVGGVNDARTPVPPPRTRSPRALTERVVARQRDAIRDERIERGRERLAAIPGAQVRITDVIA